MRSHTVFSSTPEPGEGRQHRTFGGAEIDNAEMESLAKFLIIFCGLFICP